MAIEVLPDSEGKVLGVRARAKLTAKDYEEIWVPRLRKLIDERGSVRVLLFMSEDFEGREIGESDQPRSVLARAGLSPNPARPTPAAAPSRRRAPG